MMVETWILLQCLFVSVFETALLFCYVCGLGGWFSFFGIDGEGGLVSMLLCGFAVYYCWR